MLKNRSSLALECEKERWFIKDTSRTFIFFILFFFLYSTPVSSKGNGK